MDMMDEEMNEEIKIYVDKDNRLKIKIKLLHTLHNIMVKSMAIY